MRRYCGRGRQPRGKKNTSTPEGNAVRTETGDTPSRPPGFSNTVQQQSSERRSKNESANNGRGGEDIPSLPSSKSMGSKGNELLHLLNGMQTGEDPNLVLNNMQKFIEIGVTLGYDIEGYEDTRRKLIKSMGELVVDK